MVDAAAPIETAVHSSNPRAQENFSLYKIKSNPDASSRPSAAEGQYPQSRRTWCNKNLRILRLVNSNKVTSATNEKGSGADVGSSLSKLVFVAKEFLFAFFALFWKSSIAGRKSLRSEAQNNQVLINSPGIRATG